MNAIQMFIDGKGRITAGTVSFLVGAILFCGLPSLVKGQAIDPLTGLPIQGPAIDPLTGLPVQGPAIDPLTGLPVVQAPTQPVTQAPVTTAAPVSTTSSASSTGVVRVNLRGGASAVVSTAPQRIALRTPTPSSGYSRTSTRGASINTAFAGTGTGTGTSTGGNAQTNAAGNTFGNWQESANIVDMGATSGTIDLVFATGPQTDQMTIYYPPRGQAGSKLIKDTGQLATPNNGKDLAQGATITVAFGPGTSTQVEIVVNEGTTNARGTIWSYAGTGTGTGGQTVTINGSMSGTTTTAPSTPAPIVPVIPRGITRVNLRQP